MLDGEVMDAKMENFIEIHTQNEMHQKAEKHALVDQQYTDPFTGCHFEYKDLVRRLTHLQQRRAIIDQAIMKELQMEQ